MWILPMLIRVILIGLVTPSIFLTWVSLEISLFLFLALIKFLNNKSSAEEVVYYFVVQALGRTLILFSWLSSLTWRATNIVFLLALILKLGIFPFHRWYINLVNVINYSIFWILRVPLKIIVLKLIIASSNLSWLTALALTNILISFVWVFKEKKIVSFLAFTSVFNTGWAMLALQGAWLWLIFIIIYGLNLKLILLAFDEAWKLSFFNKINVQREILHQHLLVIGLILMGLPPFSGFTIKVLIFFQLLDLSWFVATLRLGRSVIISFYYLIMFFFNLSRGESLETLLSASKISKTLRLILLNLGLSLVLIVWVTYYLYNKSKNIKIKLGWLLKKN